MISFSVRQDFKDWLDWVVTGLNTSRSEFIREAIQEKIKREERIEIFE